MKYLWFVVFSFCIVSINRPVFAGLFIGSPVYTVLAENPDVSIWIQEDEDEESELIGPFLFQRRVFEKNEFFRKLLIDSGMKETASDKVVLRQLTLPIFNHLVDMVVLGTFSGFDTAVLRDDSTYLDQFFAMIEYYNPPESVRVDILRAIEALIQTHVGQDFESLYQLLPRIDFYPWLHPMKKKIRKALVQTLKDPEFSKGKTREELLQLVSSSKKEINEKTVRWLEKKISGIIQPSLKAELIRKTEEAATRSKRLSEKHLEKLIQNFDKRLKTSKAIDGTVTFNIVSLNKLLKDVTGRKVKLVHHYNECCYSSNNLEGMISIASRNHEVNSHSSDANSYALYLLLMVAEHYDSVDIEVKFKREKMIFSWN
jgi:hypothetical protein